MFKNRGVCRPQMRFQVQLVSPEAAWCRTSWLCSGAVMVTSDSMACLAHTDP